MQEYEQEVLEGQLPFHFLLSCALPALVLVWDCRTIILSPNDICCIHNMMNGRRGPSSICGTFLNFFG